MRLETNVARRRCLAAVLATIAVPTLPTPPSSALIGEVISDGFTQADDKSWDFTLPPSWKLSDTNPRAEFPAHIFHAHAKRTAAPGGGAPSMDIVVDRLKKKGGSLAEYGKLEAVAERLRMLLPQPATLSNAAVVQGAVKGSSYYRFDYRLDGGGGVLLKLSVQQGRSYLLTVNLPSSSTQDVQAEAEAILQSFKAFPVNIICSSQSNSGTEPVPGSCY